PVGAPFHSSLMSGIEERFAAALAEVPFAEPAIAIVSSVTGVPVADAGEARAVLRRQLTARVRWTATVTRMTAAGVGRYVEVGPGTVLGGLCRRIVPGAPVHATHNRRQRAMFL